MQKEIIAIRGSQWLRVFHEQAQSGQSVARWCEENHVSSSTFYRWKRALREEILVQMGGGQEKSLLPEMSRVAENELQFAVLAKPVSEQDFSCPSSVQAVNVQSIQIRIGEITIEVPDGADSNHLEMVLKAVRNAR